MVTQARADSNVDPQAAATYVFVCPDRTEFVVRTTRAEAWVFHPNGTLKLPAAAGATGNSFSEGGVELRITGEQAHWLTTGNPPQVCSNDRRRAIWEKAKLDGVDFRAIGNEPPWVLEIRRMERIVLVLDYGAKQVDVPLPPHTDDRDTGTSRWDAGELRLEVVARPCSDSMSGEAFESEVVVTWQGRTLRGCGRALH
ncbi:hypothetical protein [uncultured Piscinibacter sp.]|uniref:COG3650 family protein n=1 Tax=uncultured Piscinibacter sp. TaxID=1131835 RepID=UPI0026181823|nr:hypothetical protein [uncultured Piscinibacter sp.]